MCSRIALSAYVIAALALMTSGHNEGTYRCKPATLTHLDCSNVGLTALPLQYMKNVTKTLTHLDLSNNKIANLSEINLPKLVHLNLSHNVINESISAFKSLPELQYLDLSYNRIINTTLKDNFRSMLSKLKILNLSHNPMRNIAFDMFEISEISSLLEIDISYCDLTSVDGSALIGAMYLQRVNMRGNKINDETITKAFELSGVVMTYLDAGENNITLLKGTHFKTLGSLKNLQLDGNKIHAIELDAFEELKYLDILNLDNNNFTYFPSAAFSEFSDLKTLHFSGNPIIRIHTDHKDIKISDITMDNSVKLTKIGDHAFSGLHKLRSLKIRNSTLETIHKDAFIGTNIRSLSLTNNKLTTIPHELLNWNSLEQLSLQGNPWYCVCSLEWLRNVSRHWHIDLICDGPAEVRGKELAQLPDHSLPCMAFKTKGIIIGMTMIVVVFLFIVALFVIRRRVKKTNGWRHCWRRTVTCEWFGAADEYEGNRYTTVHVYNDNIDASTVKIVSNEYAQELGSDAEDEAEDPKIPKIIDELDLEGDNEMVDEDDGSMGNSVLNRVSPNQRVVVAYYR